MGDQWYARIAGQEVGPLTTHDLVAMLGSGKIHADDAVRSGVSGPWTPVNEILGRLRPQTPVVATAGVAEDGTAKLGELAVGGAADDYGFLSDMAGLEDAESESAPDRDSLARSVPVSSQSSENLLAGLADLEDAAETAPSISRGERSEDLLDGLADLEDVMEPLAPSRPNPPVPARSAAAKPTAPTAVDRAAAAHAANDPSALMELLARLDSDYRQLRSQLAERTPNDVRWQEPPPSTGYPGGPFPPSGPSGYGSGYGPPPGYGSSQGYGPVGYPSYQAPPPASWGGPPSSGQWPAISPPPAASPSAHAEPSRPAPPLKLPPVGESPKPSPPKPAGAAEATRPEPPSPPAAAPSASHTPKHEYQAGATKSGASNVLRDMAAAQVRSAQAASRPASRSSGGGGGLNFDLGNLSGKHVGIAAAIVAVLIAGYFGRGMFGSLGVGTRYDETAKLYSEFKTASANGSKSPQFTTFYGGFKARQQEVLKALGSPSPGSKGHKVKQAAITLGSAVEAFHRPDMTEDDRAIFKKALDDQMTKLKAEFGR